MEHASGINNEIEIDLVLMLRFLIKRCWFIAIGAILGATAVFVITTFILTPRYQSSAVIYMLGGTTSITSWADVQIGGALAEDFLFMVQSRPVLDGAVEIVGEQGLNVTRGQARNMLEVNSVGTRMIRITVTSADPTVAYMVADAVTTAAVVRIGQITLSDPPTVVEMAEMPLSPMTGRINMVLGIFAGILLFASILIVRFIFNDHIKTEDDVKKFLNQNTLVVIPLEGK
ncbi:MAG: Wzz/FepE/Etk N-terminal domain-containing protein [Oscillospiraceae bacterium]|nr:Wzz/FepE/Etk N-terminal domain-containing protein [Oscillospiraceae bacterium]